MKPKRPEEKAEEEGRSKQPHISRDLMCENAPLKNRRWKGDLFASRTRGRHQ
jgi:hypothetical protein